MTCDQLMTLRPTVCRTDHTLAEVAAMMKRDDVGVIPVVEGETTRLVGVITDRDIVVRAVGEGLEPAQTAADAVMTPNPVTCRPEQPAEAALALMTSHRIRRVPVVNERGEIVGIISQADVATRLRDAEETAEVVEAISESNVPESP